MKDNRAAGRYNQIVARHEKHSKAPTILRARPCNSGSFKKLLPLTLMLLCGCFLPVFGQEEPPELPPEEDETYAAPREYSFNPLQAEKELKVARFYMKKGSYRAAILRAQEALKWDDGLLDAYVLLGEARQKNNDPDGARKAYLQFLETAPDDNKQRRDVQRRAEKLRAELAREAAKADKP